MQAPRCLLASLLLASPVSASIWAHYSFDTNYNDVSGNARNGTLTDVGTAGNSGVTNTAGNFKFGTGALNLAADRDYVAIPSNTFANGSTYTIAFWARKNSGDTGQAADWDMVIGQRDNSNHFIALNDSTGTGFRWRGTANSTATQADFAVTKDYVWHHYAFVASGTTVTLYVDGQLFNSATGKTTEFNIDTIGEAYVSSSDYDFNGQIDEVWIYDEALTATAVQSLFQSNDTGAPPPYAGFHHRYDGNFTDSGSGGNNGTAAGAAAITTDPAAIAAGSGALALDGADTSFVTLPATGSYSATQPWSATWWARRQAIGNDKGMVMGNSDNTTDFIWLNDANTGLRFRSSNNTTIDFTVAKDSNLHHYALVADGAGSLALYVDGQATQTLSGNTAFSINAIGKAYPTTTLHYNFQGTLDEVHLTPVALNATQVADLHAAEKPAGPPVTRVRVILIGGQSNADGRAVVTDLPAAFQSPQNDVDFYYRIEGGAGTLTTLRPGLSETSQFGPEILLGSRLADLYANESGTRVAIIKYANGGTNLYSQWKAGGNATTTGDGPEYVTFQQTVATGRAALAAKYPAATLELDSMVWMQGESDVDAGASATSAYQANLTTFIADVRATYDSSLPFIIGRLSSSQTALDATGLATVRVAQNAIAAGDPRTAVISSDGFSMKSDNLHFSATGQQSLGNAFAEEAAYYAWMVETFSAADISAGLAEPDADQDSDGQSNRSEFLGASNPKSGESAFIASISVSSPTSGSITYPSTPSRLYAVEGYNEGTGLWTTILPYTQGGAGQTSRALSLSGARARFRVNSKLP
ncbi:LamG-like jellyroll fold domain-containing protein [Luteolibacter soli]|uniref:LamG-like jellyroll fold domain-containing protein n=1 Tax=Luteolibacter soli TaxID=3135280 RepID=A0ABU9AVW9_9BACT